MWSVAANDKTLESEIPMVDNIQSYVSLLKRLAPQASRLTLDSRHLREGDVFIAIPGLHRDGRDFLAQAAEKASALVYEDDGIRRTFGVPAIAVPELGRHVGEFAAGFYRDPSASLFGIGITGTNGKTTSSHWMAQLFTHLGEKCAAIGTIGCFMEGHSFESAPLTTPDAVTLQGLYRTLVKNQAKAFAIEASSIGLEQGRLQGTRFDVAVFTNLTRDHLDYHHDMQAYERAKGILFDWPGLQHAVINIDDEAGCRFAERCAHRGIHTIVTTMRGAIALTGTHLLAAENVRPMPEGMQFDIVFGAERHTVNLSVFGAFNISNLLGVIGAALCRGFVLSEIVEKLPLLIAPAGRMQKVPHDGAALAIVDYSHTPDAVQKALEALRGVAKVRRGKLWVVLGAGGDRDAGKRPIMARVAEENADHVILTSDNPRSEDPNEILRQMLAGAQTSPQVIVDRREAISTAIKEAAAEDVVLIAGKGHELYQEIEGVKHPFSDVIEARNAQWLKNPPSGALLNVKFLSKLLPGSRLFGSDVPFTNVCTDTRKVTQGSLFFALKGERFDGHDFADQAMKAGAVALVVDHELYCPLPQIIVKDVKMALGVTSGFWRRGRSLALAAVAGSNGKTTTTQMIATILKLRYGDNAFSTQGNLNNDIGVPLMLWSLRDHHEAAVIETGMNHVGEMRYLSGLVQPTIALVTNAQREHQEFLQTVEATARENGEVFRVLPSSGIAVIPSDDPCRPIWLGMAQHANIMTFGIDAMSDVTGCVKTDTNGMTALIKTPVGTFEAKMMVRGEHNFKNALAATAVCLAMNVSLEMIQRGLESFEAVKGRGQVHQVGNVTIIDDAYNANPDSMKAAIDLLTSYPAPRLFIVGDMGELGARSISYHEEVGAYAAEKHIDGFYATGQNMRYAVQKFKSLAPKAHALWQPDRDKFIETVLKDSRDYRTISVKASNYMKLSTVVNALVAEANKEKKD